MIPVMMNGPIEADGQQSGCFEACLASILDVPAESIPRLYRDNMNDFWLAVQSWARDAGVEVAIRFNPPPTVVAEFHIRTFVVAHAELGDADHAVVYRGDEQAHDPGVVKRKKLYQDLILTVARHPITTPEVAHD